MLPPFPSEMVACLSCANSLEQAQTSKIRTLICQINFSQVNWAPDLKRWCDGAVLRPPAEAGRSMWPVTSSPLSPASPGATRQIAFQEMLPKSGGQWLCCVQQKRTISLWDYISYRMKEFKKWFCFSFMLDSFIAPSSRPLLFIRICICILLSPYSESSPTCTLSCVYI